MAVIHRLICTHCTFGSSELEPSTAENAAKVLGYSVRRSSLAEPDRGPLRTVFRAVERVLSYEVPKDTPPAKKEALEAGTAPRRLVFLPNLGGWQAAAHVAYRTRDTHGRIGSYFADVLAARLEKDSRPWSPLDVLQLWSASHDGTLCAEWWCDSEEALSERDGEGRWKPADFSSPAEPRGCADPLINDRLLHSLLTSETVDAAHDPGAIVPTRWWSMPAAQRRDLLAALLNATIQSRRNGGKESVVIAAEPSVAALLFYGVFRLLPPRLREGTGFSTYEAAPERPLTPLVATTFLDGETSTAELPAELAGRGFACNTFRDIAKFGRTTPPPADGYVRRAIELAATPDAWKRLDGFLAAIDELPRQDVRTLDEFARIDAFVTEYVTCGTQLEKPGREPPSSHGSDGEKYRRIRFRRLIDEVAAHHVGRWPRDFVRKAIAWLGEEFSAEWNRGGPMVDALRSRLPDDDMGLAKIFEALKPCRTIPPAFVGEAVARVALAASPPGLPLSFARFIGGDREKDAAGGVRADATLIVQAVLERLVAENRQELLESPDAAFVEPILDAIVAWEKCKPGTWIELRLPLLPLVERELQVTRTSPFEHAAFLVRHDALAAVLAQCAAPPVLSDQLDTFFSTLLRCGSTGRTRLHPGQLLSADGRSQTKSFEPWLRFARPENAARYRELLAAWRTVHESIVRLRSPAEKAGWYSKCPEDLSGFAHAHELLTRDNQVPGKDASQKMGVFLSKSLDGLKIVDEAARKTIVRWLVASLSVDLGNEHGSRLPLSTPSVDAIRRTAGNRSRPNQLRVYAGLGASAIIAAATIVGVALWWPGLWSQLEKGRQAEKQPATQPPAGKSVAARTATPSQGTPPAETNATKKADAEPAHKGANDTPTTPRTDAAQLMPEALGFDAQFEAGAIKTTWKKDAVAEAQLAIRITAPGKTPPKEERITDVASGSKTWELKGEEKGFGDYVVQLIAQPQGAPPVESAKVKVSIPAPPAPKVEHAHIVVAKDGQPTLNLRVAASSKSDLDRYGACKAVLSMPDGSPVRETTFSDSLTFPLPEDRLKPSDVLDKKRALKLHLQTALGPGTACEIPAPSTGKLREDLCDRLRDCKSAGVSHVCPLPEDYKPGEATPLLELPWWFVDDGLASFDLQLLTSKKTFTADDSAPDAVRLTPCVSSTNSLKQWECRTGEAAVGFFEIPRPHSNPWKPELRFVATDKTSDHAELAYERLRTCRLCFLKDKIPFCTTQLIKPYSKGPLTFLLPKDKNQEELPPLVAKAGLPAEWVNMSLSKFLWVENPTAQPLQGITLSLTHPDAGRAFIAKLVASQANQEITANMNLIKHVNGRETLLQINTWKWSKAPSHNKSRKQQAFPAVSKESVSPKKLAPVGDRRDRVEKLKSTVNQLEQELNKETDDNKRSDKRQKHNDAKNELDALNNERKENNDELFLPCFELFESLVEKDIEFSNWQLEWRVDHGNLGPDIPGGLTVVGAVGNKDGAPAVKFKPQDK